MDGKKPSKYCIGNPRALGSAGRHFFDPEEYDYPYQWVNFSCLEIFSFGVPHLFVSNQLLTDENSYVYVYFSHHSYKSRYYNHKHIKTSFIDVYQPDGNFVDRVKFENGSPEVIYNQKIYSKIISKDGSFNIAISKISGQ